VGRIERRGGGPVVRAGSAAITPIGCRGGTGVEHEAGGSQGGMGVEHEAGGRRGGTWVEDEAAGRRRRCRFRADHVGRKTRRARLVGNGNLDLTVLALGD
jgi:hypothetical protein